MLVRVCWFSTHQSLHVIFLEAKAARELERYPIYTRVNRYYLVGLDSSTCTSQWVFLRFTVFTFILGELCFLNGFRHSLVEAGSFAVLMTMALRCPMWTVLSLNDPQGTISSTEPLSPHQRHIYWSLLFQDNWESRKSFDCIADSAWSGIYPPWRGTLDKIKALQSVRYDPSPKGIHWQITKLSLEDRKHLKFFCDNIN